MRERDSRRFSEGPQIRFSHPVQRGVLRDYSRELTEDEEKKNLEKAREAVEKGWAAGPFDLPPFRSTSGLMTERCA